MPRVPAWIAAGLAGGAAALGHAPWGLWWLALAAFALGLGSVARARRPVLAAWVMGTAHFAVALLWLTEPFRVDPSLTGWLAWPALGAAAVGFGAFWAVGAGVGARALGGPVGAGLGMAAAELARSYVLTGFPWALPGHVLIGSPALPAAAYAGQHGMTLAVLLGAGLVACARPLPTGAGLVVLAVPLALGAARPAAPPPAADAPTVRLVQPNAPQHLKWDPDWRPIFYARAVDLTEAGPPPDLVVWPETSMPSRLSFTDGVRPEIAARAPAVVGTLRIDRQDAPRNALVLLERGTGRVLDTIDKHRLVPFGEYLPLPRVADALGLGPLAAQMAGVFAPGPGPRLLETPVGRMMPMICYEAIFPQDLRRVARPRAILHLTNDAWFGTRVGPFQHLALARLRAAEQGLPLLRAANTGVSAVIDARGRVLDALPLGEAGALDAALPPALPPTPYARLGDLPVALLLLALALLWLLSRPVDLPPRGAQTGRHAPTAS
ncbi:apolipoprotein N-acyltransferase [Jannaschia sp. Os4]|uniref:apolipoprotein N-acyltransferase n=1 Tax=Jannaschia sp. Os4 TaxID=2807617 RepID=UPI00193ACA8A|nr:apolipoprotein N-acyltransferase [Jannaschia sp. Os4]MBM2576252.1 apolipoprotein N-acyltransferase [Jannaschia sp. Os4]